MPVDSCIDDGTVIGAWTFVCDGFGCTGFVSLTGNIVLIELPQAAAQPTETHAGLALGPATVGDVTVQVDMATRRQLRTGSAPNAWEVGWLLWRFTDSQDFYYFIPKQRLGTGQGGPGVRRRAAAPGHGRLAAVPVRVVVSRPRRADGQHNPGLCEQPPDHDVHRCRVAIYVRARRALHRGRGELLRQRLGKRPGDEGKKK
jgi:hypothetical protein